MDIETKICSACPESQGIKLDNLTTWQPDNLTLLRIDMKTKVVQHDNHHDDYYDYHDNYHDDYHNENHDYRDDYHDVWTLNLSHLVHLWKHCFPCSMFYSLQSFKQHSDIWILSSQRLSDFQTFFLFPPKKFVGTHLCISTPKAWKMSVFFRL